MINQLESQILDLEKRKKDIINNFKAVLFITECYSSEYYLIQMLGYLRDKRVSNWERCTDLYEEEHRSKMERLVKMRARQAELQTERTRQTRDAARWTAVGAWASAASIWRINSKL